MKVITVVTNHNNLFYTNILRPSAEIQKLKLETIMPSDGYGSHRAKDDAVYQHLQSLNDDEIVFFTDGYDTLLLCGEEELLDKYNQAGKDIVFSAETVCWPDADLADQYPKTNSPFKYLNSGGFIGKAGAIREFIKQNLKTASIAKFSFSNQIYWTEQYLRNQDRIGLDTLCKFFCVLSSSHDSELRNAKGSKNLKNYIDLKTKWFHENFTLESKRLLVNTTGEKPCQVHFNGWTKVLLPEVLKHLPFEGEHQKRLLMKLNTMGEYLFAEGAQLLEE